MLKKIVSGGQTGADRAALDAALAADFPAGGYCPRGRMAEDGCIDARYPLRELHGGYLHRTRRNVETSDGTVIFYDAEIQGGTAQTLAFCVKTGKPYQLIDIRSTDSSAAADVIQRFILDNQISILNVAGPRHSKCPAIYDFVKTTIGALISVLPARDKRETEPRPEI